MNKKCLIAAFARHQLGFFFWSMLCPRPCFHTYLFCKTSWWRCCKSALAIPWNRGIGVYNVDRAPRTSSREKVQVARSCRVHGFGLPAFCCRGWAELRRNVPTRVMKEQHRQVSLAFERSQSFEGKKTNSF